MISGTSRNYVGRKVDLSLFPAAQQPGVPVNAEFGARPKVTAGPSKAVQQFAVALLTPLGHYRADPEYGSNFLQSIVQQQMRLPTQLAFVFIKEAERVLRWMRLRLPDDRPDDEVLSKVTMIGSNLDRTSVSLTITCTLRSTDAVQFLLPINWSPR